MPEPDSKPDLMPALGRMVQGLSALFWGLPLALIIGVQTARTDWLNALGPAPVLAAACLLLFGVHQLGYFQPHERIWVSVLDRARLPALVNIGLSPFLYWWHHLPQTPFFGYAISILAVSSLVFMMNLNLVVSQLSAMLPDATMRQESRFFSAMNRNLLTGALLYLSLGALLANADTPWRNSFGVYLLFVHARLWFLGLFILLPVAMTMALLWKIKETIMANVFQSPGR